MLTNFLKISNTHLTNRLKSSCYFFVISTWFIFNIILITVSLFSGLFHCIVAESTRPYRVGSKKASKQASNIFSLHHIVIYMYFKSQESRISAVFDSASDNRRHQFILSFVKSKLASALPNKHKITFFLLFIHAWVKLQNSQIFHHKIITQNR